MPSDLEPVAAVLRENRASPGRSELHQLKRRVLARHASRLGKQWTLRRHLVTVLTMVGLIGGTGGALAVAGGSAGNSAAASQYCKDIEHRHHHVKCEKKKKHRKLVHKCPHDKYYDKHKKACRQEKREIKKCHKGGHSKKYCKKHASPINPASSVTGASSLSAASTSATSATSTSAIDSAAARAAARLALFGT